MAKQRRGGKNSGRLAKDILEGLPPLNLNAAGIDVGNATHYVAVPPGREAQPVGEFGSFTADLHRMARWLKACRVDTVVMQATGVYWIGLYQVLEEHGLNVLGRRRRGISHCLYFQTEIPRFGMTWVGNVFQQTAWSPLGPLRILRGQCRSAFRP